MTRAEPEIAECSGVRPELIRDDRGGSEALFLEYRPNQLHGRALVAPPLDQHVKDLALVIHGTPEIHPLAPDPNDHLVEMPPGAWPRAPLAKLPGKCRSELEDPAAHGLVGDIDAALSHEVLDVAIAQSEPNVKPNRVPDNRCRKVVVAIGDAGHRGTLPRGVDGGSDRRCRPSRNATSRRRR